MDYSINVAEIEELQDLRDREALLFILDKARRSIIQGAEVFLYRKTNQGQKAYFDTIHSESELEAYKNQVLKYL